MISQKTYDDIMANQDVLDSAIIYERDFHYVSTAARFYSIDALLIILSTLVELLWLQDTRALVPAAHQWQGR